MQFLLRNAKWKFLYHKQKSKQLDRFFTITYNTIFSIFSLIISDELFFSSFE